MGVCRGLGFETEQSRRARLKGLHDGQRPGRKEGGRTTSSQQFPDLMTRLDPSPSASMESSDTLLEEEELSRRARVV